MTGDLRIFPPKKIPTRVKHFVLENCLDAWGGIIMNSNQNVRLAFVDTCCGSGLYQPDAYATAAEDHPAHEMGSALLGPAKLLEIAKNARARGRSVEAKALVGSGNSGLAIPEILARLSPV